MKARDLAKGRWRGVLTQLGIDAKFLDGKHHPCPASGQGEDRFRFADRNGSGNFFCNCSTGQQGGLALVMCCKGISYAEAAREVEQVVGKAEPDAEKPKRDPRPALRRVQALLRPVGEPVARYLRGRGLEVAPGLYQARLTYWLERGKSAGVFDCMVGKVVASDGSPSTFHLTYLAAGEKAAVDSPRKVMTPIGTKTGGAIRLYPQAAHLGIAEGIETAIAAHLLSGLPVWSVLDANGVQSFEPPAGVERVTIFADNDPNGVGQAAAWAACARLRRRGIECDVRIPEGVKDWNDALRAQAAAA